MSENYYLKIADLNLCLSNGNATQITELLAGIDTFRTDCPDNIDINIALNADIDVTVVQSAKLICDFTVDNVQHILRGSADKYYFETYDLETETSYFLKYEWGTQTVEIGTCNKSRHFSFLMWTAFSLVALQYGVIFIHSSVVEHQEQAILFLGESGTGKSTQSRLWIENIAETQLLNDDSPALRIVNNKLIVYGSPWSGKTPCYRNVAYQAKAIVRVKRAHANTINNLNTLESIAAIYPSLPPMFAHDERLADILLDFVSEVIERTPIYTLKCKPDAEAAIITHQEIYGNMAIR